MTYTHIEKAIGELKLKQKIFHSEADFQFSFAWELQKQLPTAKIRLEYCPQFDLDMHIDLYIIDGIYSYPIELKYKSKKIEICYNDEFFNLKNQGAQDLGRYDFLYDISRIEKIRNGDSRFRAGYAIMLTNDSSYWSVPSLKNTIDSAFRIHEGRSVSGEIFWGDGAGLGTTKGRDPFVIQGQYKMKWLPFSTFDHKNGVFQYNVVEVT